MVAIDYDRICFEEIDSCEYPIMVSFDYDGPINQIIDSMEQSEKTDVDMIRQKEVFTVKFYLQIFQTGCFRLDMQLQYLGEPSEWFGLMEYMDNADDFLAAIPNHILREIS